MTDGTLFSVHVKNQKILSEEKVMLRGCFVISPPFLAYHHLPTHTENTFNFESYILEGTIFMSDRVFLIQKSPTWAKFS